MALDSTTKAIGKEAWSQLMHSIISDDPPSGMSREYYYARPVAIERFQRDLKRNGVDRFQLGAENFQPKKKYDSIEEEEEAMRYRPWTQSYRDQRKRYQDQRNVDNVPQGINNTRYDRRSRDDEVLQVNEDIYEQGVDHIEYAMRSIAVDEVLQEDEDRYQQGIDHIQYARRTIRDDEVVQENEDGYQQGIDHIQYARRTIRDDEVVQENEDGYQQGIDHIQYAIRTIRDDEVVQEDEDRYQQGIDHIQYARRTIRDDEVVQENEDRYQQGIDHIQYARRTIRDDEVVQENEDRYQQGIDQIQYAMRSINVDDKVVQENEYRYQKGINHVQFDTRSFFDGTVLQANRDNYQQGIEHSQYAMKTTDDEIEQAIEGHYDESEHKHKVLSILPYSSDLVNDMIWERNSTLRSEVLELYELIKEEKQSTVQYPFSTARYRFSTPEYLKKQYRLPTPEYQKKRLELILRICDIETCERTICKYISNSGRDQYCKKCEVLQTVKDESQRGVKQAKATIALFDELLKLVKNRVLQGNKKPRVKVLKLIKVLHHYGVDTIRSEVTEELEKLNEMYDGTMKDSTKKYKKNALEVMLRICDTETCQKKLYEIITQARMEHNANIL